MTILDDYPFALCLTHDLDRVYKTYQSVYYALTERDPGHLLDLLPGRNPYWQFEEIMALERGLDVRSAFYVLSEQKLFRDRHPSDWVRSKAWKLYAGRYSIEDPTVLDALSALDEGGWEIGLHGSYDSYRDADRLRREKGDLEAVVDQPIRGGRQHYLNLERPRTWQHHADVGLRYDATLGSAREYGFQYGYEPMRPFDDEFVVFPLTLMETTLPNVEDDPATAWSRCRSLLEEAHANGAAMTVLWHPQYFSEREYPNYRSLYRRLIERAQEMGAWVGPPGELYRSLDHSTDAATATSSSATPSSVSPSSATSSSIGNATESSTIETVQNAEDVEPTATSGQVVAGDGGTSGTGKTETGATAEDD